VPESSWYDPPPARPRHRVRRRDKVEFAIAFLLLTGLLGLLAAGVARDGPGAPGPATTIAPSPQPAYARIAVPGATEAGQSGSGPGFAR
jgi:hypothetical protein